jgi:hypothetical protein
MKNQSTFIYCLILAVFALQACYDYEKFTNSPSAYISFSTDTVQFDTVFTSIGSATLQMKVYNKNKDAIRTDIKLASGQNSYYRLNIDGVATDEYDDLEIMGNDSAFIFVEVNVDPQNSNSPIVITDSIMFYTNGNTQNVKLVAYGQDVHLYNDSVIGTTHWLADKPYLVFNSVMVDSLGTLTIDAGAKIHFHTNSSLLVKGTLLVNGTKDLPVVFQGDRLEDWYENKPGQWGATYKNDSVTYTLGNIHLLNGSYDNVINYAEIKNGIKGIQIDNHTNSDKPTLTLSNSIIKNMSIAGIYAQTTNLLVYNSVIANCNYYATVLSLGGHYEFYHSTIANHPNASRSTESLIFNNYYTSNDQSYVYDFDALFANCIIYGDLDQEFAIDSFPTNEVKFDFLFDHCLMKLAKSFNISDTNCYKDIISNADSLPRFKNISEGNYRLDTLSAAKDKGNIEYSRFIPTDFDGNNRLQDGLPDLGAFERIEQ